MVCGVRLSTFGLVGKNLFVKKIPINWAVQKSVKRLNSVGSIFSSHEKACVNLLKLVGRVTDRKLLYRCIDKSFVNSPKSSTSTSVYQKYCINSIAPQVLHCKYCIESIVLQALHKKYCIVIIAPQYCKSIVSQILNCKYCITARWQAVCSRVIIVGMKEEDGTTGTMLTARHHSDHVCLVWILLSSCFCVYSVYASYFKWVLR